MIGKILGTTYVKREKETSILRMGGGSWTIKIDELEGRQVSLIRFITAVASYEITLEDAVANGFEKILGGEAKLIVPVRHWKLSEREGLA